VFLYWTDEISFLSSPLSSALRAANIIGLLGPMRD
jgi:hypothetical protein